MRRREFIGLVGSATVFPVSADGQQRSLPVIGFVDSRSIESMGNRLRGFRRGLEESGHTEGQTVAIEYRWAENRMDRLPDLVADLAQRHVDVTSGVSLELLPQRRPRRASRSSFSPPKIQLSSGWSGALLDRAAT